MSQISFFSYCDELLHRYRASPRGGNHWRFFQAGGSRASSYSYDFSSDLRIWGWATWAEPGKGLSTVVTLRPLVENEREEIVARFPTGPRRASMSRMLSQAAQLDSWALPFCGPLQESRVSQYRSRSKPRRECGLWVPGRPTRLFEDYVAQLPSQPWDFSSPSSSAVAQRTLRLIVSRVLVIGLSGGATLFVTQWILSGVSCALERGDLQVPELLGDEAQHLIHAKVCL